MDYNAIVQAIGAVGFPIVACCGFFWMINTTMKELTATIGKLDTSIVQLTDELRKGKE